MCSLTVMKCFMFLSCRINSVNSSLCHYLSFLLVQIITPFLYFLETHSISLQRPLKKIYISCNETESSCLRALNPPRFAWESALLFDFQPFHDGRQCVWCVCRSIGIRLKQAVLRSCDSSAGKAAFFFLTLQLS